ncbi:MAG: alpha/beta fold hydrolase [Betaproteobacteria bacterium]
MRTWVLLRGLTRESRHWSTFPEDFCRQVTGAKVLTPELPGNGILNAQRSPSTVEEMVESIRAQLRQQNVPPPYHVLAESLGGMMAVWWAARYPEEVSAAVLINTSLRALSPFYRRLKPASYCRLLKLGWPGCSAREREEIVLALTSRNPESVERVLNDWEVYRRENPVRIGNALRQLLAAARFSAPSIKPAVPMLVLFSSNDDLVDASCSRQIAKHWATAWAEHPTAGHDLPLDDGVWVASQVRVWLNNQSQRLAD